MSANTSHDMRKLFELGALVIFLFILIGCKTDKKNKMVSYTNEVSVQKVVIDSTPPKKSSKVLEIPFIREYELSLMTTNSSKIYLSGDCGGNIHSLSDLTITIDSLSCGDHGFTNTEYIYSNKKIQAVHQVMSDYNNGSDYTLTEIIYDLRDSTAHVFKRVDTVNYEVTKTDKKFDKTLYQKRDSIAKYWTDSNNEAWLLEFDEEF